MRKILILLIDATLALLLWASAVGFRIFLGQENSPNFLEYLKYGAILGVLTIFCFHQQGLYKSLHFRSRGEELFTVLRANAYAVLAFILLAYFFEQDRVSRGTLLIYFGFSSMAFVVERLIVRSVLRWARKQSRHQRNVILVGNGEPLRDYLKVIKEHSHLGIRAVGWIDKPEWAKDYGIPALQGPNAGHETKADVFVLSYTSEQSHLIDVFIKKNYNDLTKIFVLPTFKSYALLGLRLEDFAGVPILALNQPHHPTRELVLKRLLDIVGALIGLTLFGPLMLLIAILVKLTSPGPIFFGQERMGLDGKTFKMWKFRTMKVGPSQPGWTVKDDPRRTKFGTFLRSTSLDELPQFWNVLVGDMSLVGPRPEQPYYVEKFRNEIPAYMLRHKMKAGITGWAQVNGWRGDTSIEKRIECDLYYIRNWSILFDIKILILTVWSGIVNKNAY